MLASTDELLGPRTASRRQRILPLLEAHSVLSLRRVRAEVCELAPCVQGSEMEFRMFFKDGDKQISPWHDIPLQAASGTYNFVCEIPKESDAKMECAIVCAYFPGPHVLAFIRCSCGNRRPCLLITSVVARPVVHCKHRNRYSAVSYARHVTSTRWITKPTM